MKNLERRFAALFPSLNEEYKPTASGILTKEYTDDFDIVGLMQQAKDPDTGLLRDLKIDDSDLASAGSYYDYAFNIIKEDAHPPWLIQMWTGLMLFAEVCPVCSDKRWLSLDWIVEHVDKKMPSAHVVDHMKILHHGVCPKCKRNKYELLVNHGLKDYVELVNVLGQRSGKSSSAASLSSYLTHRYLKFPRLSGLTKAMQKSTELTGTFVSLTFAKAVGLLWTPYLNIINESSWYCAYHEMLDFHQNKYGIELYRKKDEYIKYYVKGLKFYPTNPKSQTLRGDTRIIAVVDELGLFPLPIGNDEEDEKSDRANADEAHKSLTNSLVTVQSVHQELLSQGINCPPALMLGVSSPISLRDKVMRRLADSRTAEGKKYILGINLPTWKVNPYIDRNSPIIASAYASNTEKAERDFGANPPIVSQTFIKPQQLTPELFFVKPTHSLSYQYDRAGLLYAKVHNFYAPKFPSVVTIDAGAVNNSFTLTGGHFNFDTQRTVVTTCLEIMPHDGRRVDFNLVYTHVILPILKALNAVVLLADQWQSMDILSRAREDLGTIPGQKDKARCVSKQYSPKRKDFDTLVSMMENRTMDLPFLSKADYDHVCSEYIEFKTLNGQPVKHLLLQMLTIKDVGEAKAPEKGEGFTDDILRALVLLTKIHDPKVLERLKAAQQWLKIAGVSSGMPTPVFLPRGF